MKLTASDTHDLADDILFAVRPTWALLESFRASRHDEFRGLLTKSSDGLSEEVLLTEEGWSLVYDARGAAIKGRDRLEAAYRSLTAGVPLEAEARESLHRFGKLGVQLDCIADWRSGEVRYPSWTPHIAAAVTDIADRWHTEYVTLVPRVMAIVKREREREEV